MSEAGAKKGGVLRNGCLIVVGVFVVLTIIGAIFGDKDGAKSSTASTDKEATAEPALAVTAVELAKAYEANEAAAQLKYGKRVLDVTATVSDIQLGLSDVPFLLLEGTNQFLRPHAELDEEGQKLAASLTKGQEVHLTCQSVKEVIGTPMLDDCHIN
ncbi:hypothetical protein [uncultured Novosphingobium sp.]|uniref:OB-fold protein n=1 Tax=uncultured Novosphingobium sp. TaxID=292277 RepID=UPI00259153BA|nr:hypothetical protein [uncultured Novosphingobium sp.]